MRTHTRAILTAAVLARVCVCVCVHERGALVCVCTSGRRLQRPSSSPTNGWRDRRLGLGRTGRTGLLARVWVAPVLPVAPDRTGQTGRTGLDRTGHTGLGRTGFPPVQRRPPKPLLLLRPATCWCDLDNGSRREALPAYREPHIRTHCEDLPVYPASVHGRYERRQSRRSNREALPVYTHTGEALGPVPSDLTDG